MDKKQGIIIWIVLNLLVVAAMDAALFYQSMPSMKNDWAAMLIILSAMYVSIYKIFG